MNKRQRKKAKDYKSGVLTLSQAEIEALQLTDEELIKIMSKRLEDCHKRLIDDALNLSLNDGSNKNDVE